MFILVGVAIGGSGLVLGAASSFLGAGSGPSVSIVAASIRVGGSTAVESVAVEGSGGAPLGSFVLATSQAPAAATYCYSVEDLRSGALLSTTCPAPSADPGRVSVPAVAGGGGSVLVELVISGGVFAAGSSHQVSVTAADGAQANVDVQAVPA